ncbi:MAG: transposase [Candidatus Omnitrophota bacterium]
MNEFSKRKAVRFDGYDYSKPGYYYVTICTYNRERFFGHIKNGYMVLNDYGKIAKNVWLKIPNHFFNIGLDEYVIMPNHIHGIIIIDEFVGDGHARPDYRNKSNLSVIIGSYKSAVSKQIHQLNEISFKWQRFFYDHIIRTDESLNKIREYIINNPINWANDKNNL